MQTSSRCSLHRAPQSVLSLLLGLCLLGTACSSKYKPQAITAEAAVLFARADQPGARASLVVDLEVLRELRLLAAGSSGDDHFTADLVVSALAQASVQLKDEPVGPLAARAAVLAALTSRWDAWPRVQRVGLFVGGLGGNPDPQLIANGSLLVFAVKANAQANNELLRGLAAIDRSSGAPRFKREGDGLCLAGEGLPLTACLRAGEGFLAVGTPAALKGIAPPAPGAPLPTAAGPLLRLSVDLPAQGKAELLVEGHESLQVRATLQATDPRVAAAVEKAAVEGLKALDAQHEELRARMSVVLDQTKRALAADVDVPPSLKTAAEQLTLDSALDRSGDYAALRESVKLTPSNGTLTAEATLPAKQIKRMSESQGSGVLVAAAVTGMAAAIAIPNFIKFQCRSKQSEAKANLKAAWVAQKAFFSERSRYGASFGEVGFAPEHGNRYTYCMADECLMCTNESCAPPRQEQNPCLPLTRMAASQGRLAVCAIAELGDQKTDVWVVDDKGRPENVRNGCE